MNTVSEYYLRMANKGNKYTTDDILIIGDSFALSRTEMYHWPKLLHYKLTGSNDIPRGAGFGGAAWWSVRKCLLKELEKKIPKVLVLCHTGSIRIPSDAAYTLSHGAIMYNEYNSHIHKFSQEIYQAARDYYTHILSLSGDFMLWANNAWRKECDDLIADIPIVIHLNCFEEDFYNFKNGITFSEFLADIAVTTADQNVKDELKNHGVSTFGAQPNHFKSEINIRIAEILYQTIINYKKSQTGTTHYFNLGNSDD